MKKLSFLVFTLFLAVMLSTVHAGIDAISRIDLVDDPWNISNNGKVWLLQWSETKGAESIVGYITKHEFKEETGVKPEYDLRIEMIPGPQKAVYSNIQGNYKEIYSYKITYNKFKQGVTESSYHFEQRIEDWVSENCIPEFLYYRSCAGNPKLWPTYVICVSKGTSELLAHTFGLSSPTIIWSTKWKYKVGNKEPIEFEITNDRNVDSGTTKIFDHAVFQFDGAFSSGNTAPHPGGKVLSIKDNNGRYKLIDYEGYRNYINTINKIVDSFYVTIGDAFISSLHGEQEGEYWISYYNGELDTVSREAVLPTSDEEFRYAKSNPDGTYSLDLEDRKVNIPKYKVWIGADYLAIDIHYGVPKIEEYTKKVEWNEENTYGKLDVLVKNVGSDKGSFLLKVVCDKNFIVKERAITDITLYPGEDKRYIFHIIGATSDINQEYLEGSCRIIFEEETTGATDEKTVSLKMKQARRCTPGSYSASYVLSDSVYKEPHYVIYKCASDGLHKIIVDVCKPGQTIAIVGNVYKCSDMSGGGTVHNECELQYKRRIQECDRFDVACRFMARLSYRLCLIKEYIKSKALIILAIILLIFVLKFGFYGKVRYIITQQNKGVK